ncbi:MAG: lysine--tRNA ligase [Victivallaceae bacterium]|nr:lysine--tRNA ligase [Victivallaceae bacterium]
MHWSEEIARKIIARNPEKPEYVCAAGISPSGSIHIGNFRDVATSFFVVQSLRKLGKKARLLFSWDEYDRLRKVPKNVADIAPGMNEKMERYIGCPYVDVPNPFGDDAENYAVYFEREFEDAIREFGLELDYRHQAEMYRSGKYAQYILTALQKRAEIFDILASFRTQEVAEGERENYYPVSIYCPECHRDTTRIVKLSDDCRVADYECKCGHKGTFDFTADHDCKLAWKVDWPMRWLYEQVDFEPGGKDHASPNVSYQTSKVISEKIFGYPAPIFQGYEFIGIRGCTGKMSGSSGLNLTPATLLKIYQSEIILWLYSRCVPQKAFDFCFDEGILRQYQEFDAQYDAFLRGEADETTAEVVSRCLMPGKKVSTVPMNLLVQLGSVVDFRSDLVEVLVKKIGYGYTREEIDTRIKLAKFWVEQCAPEKKNTLCVYRNWDAYGTFNDEEKADVASLFSYLKKENFTLDELKTELYDIIKRDFPAGTDFSVDPAKSEVRKKQAKFFADAYRLLIDKEAGPRLYLFLFAIEREKYLHLLDFSTPRREEEVTPHGIVEAVVEEKEEVRGEPDPVKPVKPEISLEDFSKLDFRVCRIVKCTEIRKSHDCYKLTLADGIGERTIVSSVKAYYKPEELIGKKIIVLANLASKRITGVTSEGMLLAATNGACGCKIVFVDDAVPEGTCLA